MLCTKMEPDCAVGGTTAMILVSETTLKAPALPPNFTMVTPLKLAPLMVTSVPGLAVPGEKLVMRGVTVNTGALVTEPAGVVTEIGPVVAFAGTVAVMVPPLLTVKEALTPLKRTAVAPVKPVPLIVTVLPGKPPEGAKPLM